MGYSLVIHGRNGAHRSFFDKDGRCVFARHPGQVLLFAHQVNAEELAALTHCRIEYLRDMSLPAMLAAAQRIQAESGIVSVATLDERMVEAAASIRVALGLPGLDAERVRCFRDKVLMKQTLQALGIRVPRFVADLAAAATEAEQLLRECGRIVVKPRDGYGSKDVQFVDDVAGLRAFIEQCRNPESFEAEEFIAGTLYHANAIVDDGRVLDTAIAEYLPGMGNIDFGQGAPFVTLMETGGALHDRLRQFSDTIVAGFGLRSGVTHLEVFHSDRDELVFCEMGIRPGGGGIVQMVEHQYGFNLSLAALLAEEGRVGIAAPSDSMSRQRRVGLVGIRNSAVGMVSNSASDPFDDAWILHAQVFAGHGQLLTPAEHCTDLIALFIVETDDRDQFVARTAELQRRVDSQLNIVPI